MGPRRLTFFLLALAVFGIAVGAAGQALGDLSKQEAQRRKTTATGKVYTNKDLKEVPPPDVAGPARSSGDQTVDDKTKAGDKDKTDTKAAAETKSDKKDTEKGPEAK